MSKKEVKKAVNHKKQEIIIPTRTKLTFGENAADKLTLWAGSWSFIFLFLFFILVWMYINVTLIIKYNLGEPFDPYPFILLNLVLSCLAAIQAPVILMSQNRQTQRDRIRSEYDYQVNRKAEREIQQILHELNNIKRKVYGEIKK